MNHGKVKRFFSHYVFGKIHRQYKDRLFRFLFEKDREALLQIYNALNGTNYENASQLKIVTIENAMYVEMKNDLAFVVTGVLNMYEHQSTYNPNMPVRFLMYLAQEYHKIIEQAEESLYGSKLIPLPTPQCIVFYNGKRELPEEQILRLSDAFENKERNASIELEVKMLNINYGHNTELMSKCRMLKEYSEFVEISREFVSQNNNINIALNTAIDYCIEQNILSNQLRQYRAEVLDMMLGQFDKKKYECSLRNEGREIGYQEGINVGIEQGIKQGIDQGIEALILDNLEQKISEEQIILKLIKLFHLTEEQARNYFNKFNP